VNILGSLRVGLGRYSAELGVQKIILLKGRGKKYQDDLTSVDIDCSSGMSPYIFNLFG
jgi:hypothetical protein